MTRSLVRFVFRVWIGVLVAAQFAIAAHACASLAGMQVGGEPGSGVERQADGRGLAPLTAALLMADCDDNQSASAFSSANVCAERCRMGQQADHTATIAIPAAIFGPQYVVPDRPALTAPSLLTAASTLSALVAAAPSRAILHCVRRT